MYIDYIDFTSPSRQADQCDPYSRIQSAHSRALLQFLQLTYAEFHSSLNTFRSVPFAFEMRACYFFQITTTIQLTWDGHTIQEHLQSRIFVSNSAHWTFQQYPYDSFMHLSDYSNTAAVHRSIVIRRMKSRFHYTHLFSPYR